MTQCQRVWQRQQHVRQWERSPGAGEQASSGGGGGHLTLPTLLSAEPAPPAPGGQPTPRQTPVPNADASPVSSCFALSGSCGSNRTNHAPQAHSSA